ncbi:polysaccharide biosynthesis/export family protein [Nitrospira sp. Nam74]
MLKKRAICTVPSLVVLIMFMVSILFLNVNAEDLNVATVSTDTPRRLNGTEKESLVVTSKYYIGPEDVLDINVWRNKDLSKIVMVRPDGRISLPLIGDVQASGLSPAEVTADINRRLKMFVESPAVSVMVKEVNSYSIFVMGQVANPSRYFLKSKTTLLQAITLAGGFTTEADRTRIAILRWQDPRTEVRLTANYLDIVLKDGVGENVILRPGDTIVVPSETMLLIK